MKRTKFKLTRTSKVIEAVIRYTNGNPFVVLPNTAKGHAVLLKWFAQSQAYTTQLRRIRINTKALYVEFYDGMHLCVAAKTFINKNL